MNDSRAFLRILYIALGLCTVSFEALAQRPDPYHLMYHSYNSQGDSSLNAGAAAPPISIGQDRWFNGIGFRRVELSEDGLTDSSNLKPTELNLASFFTTQISNDWSATTGMLVFNRTAEGSVGPTKRSVDGKLFLQFRRPLFGSKTSSWYLGLMRPEAVEKMPVRPDIGCDIYSSDGRHQFKFSVPYMHYNFQWDQALHLGVSGHYDNAAYILPDDFNPSQESLYLQQKRVLVSLFAKRNLVSALWGSINIGSTVYGVTSLLDRSFDRLQKIQNQEGVYVSIGVSVKIDK